MMMEIHYHNALCVKLVENLSTLINLMLKNVRVGNAVQMKTKWECKDKRRYETKEEALEEIFFIIQESFGGNISVRPYRCKYCTGWHLTSK